jgi:lantibiotic modifying enzyme
VVNAIDHEVVHAREASHLEAAAELGALLTREALWHGHCCTWLGDDLEMVDGTWQVIHRSMDGTLYSGTSGIGLFLARAAAATGGSAERNAAVGALRHALRQADLLEPPARAALFEGALGTACAALEVGQTLGCEEILDAGTALVSALADELLSDPRSSGHDMISGSAGTIVGLLAAGRRLEPVDPRRQRLLAAAVAEGDALCDSSRRFADGWWWGDTAPGLCGLAHGASGPALALIELHHATREPRYRVAAAEAVRYERGWFDRAQCGWPDLRGADAAGLLAGAPAPCPALWCHGAVGIGLVRLRGYELVGDYGALAEAGAALAAAHAATWRALAPEASGTFASNASLCHGAAGAIELLVCAAVALGRDEHLLAARHLVDMLLERTAATGGLWTCGVPGGDSTPGLMLGLAGIGATLLHVADPAAYPPVGLLI